MITKEFDTIAAISTPLSVGLSGLSAWAGTDSFAIAQRSLKEKTWPAWLAYPQLRPIRGSDKNEILDEVMVGAMRSPKTFTHWGHYREINTHGGSQWPMKSTAIGHTGESFGQPGGYQARLPQRSGRFDPGWSDHGYYTRQDR